MVPSSWRSYTRSGLWGSVPAHAALLTAPLHPLSEASHVKPNPPNSTSDSDLMKYRTISQIPQFTLNFVEFNLEKHRSGSTTEIEIIAPHKVMERTQNVTEKVTQVWGQRDATKAVMGCWLLLGGQSQVVLGGEKQRVGGSDTWIFHPRKCHYSCGWLCLPLNGSNSQFSPIN